MSASARNLLVALISVSLATCGSGIDCSATQCRADPPHTQAEITGCEQDLEDPKCGTLYRSMVECYHREQTCLPNGRTDVSSGMDCQPKLQSWFACKGFVFGP
jgi:hypothetical protein